MTVWSFFPRQVEYLLLHDETFSLQFAGKRARLLILIDIDK